MALQLYLSRRQEEGAVVRYTEVCPYMVVLHERSHNVCMYVCM